MRVIFDKAVEIYLNELLNILYEKEYFGFKETAYDYVEWIIDAIERDINKIPHKIAPPYFLKYGKSLYYSVFKRNNNTQWYVFFNYENSIYYIRYIGNNHNCSHLIKQ